MGRGLQNELLSFLWGQTITKHACKQFREHISQFIVTELNNGTLTDNEYFAHMPNPSTVYTYYEWWRERNTGRGTPTSSSSVFLGYHDGYDDSYYRSDEIFYCPFCGAEL